MKIGSFIFVVLGVATGFSAAENVLMPISRLQRIGNMDVLSGEMKIAHYAKRTFTFGSKLSAAFTGEATFRISVDFSKAVLNDGELKLPKPTVWCQIEQKKTRMYKQPWTSGIITHDDKIAFTNEQYGWIEHKAQKAVSEESELMQQAQAQAGRIARGYLCACGLKDNVQKVTFGGES